MNKAGLDHSKGLSWKKKLTLIVIISVVTALMIEVGARVVFAVKVGPKALLYGTSYQRSKEVKQENHTVQQHESELGGYSKYFPNEEKIDHSPLTGETFPVTINSHGFRGREFTKAKQPGVVRIVTLGASSTFGYYDKDDETYPHFLQQRLNEVGPRRFEVINLGIPHLWSDQILALFLAEGCPYSPTSSLSMKA